MGLNRYANQRASAFDASLAFLQQRQIVNRSRSGFAACRWVEIRPAARKAWSFGTPSRDQRHRVS